MLAFVSEETIPLGSALDGRYSELVRAISLWIIIALSYHTLVVVMIYGWKDLFERGPKWFHVTCSVTSECSISQTARRISRYYKCKKRARRRGREAWHGHECSFSKLYFPSPLPYHRRGCHDHQMKCTAENPLLVLDNNAAVEEPLSDESSRSTECSVIEDPRHKKAALVTKSKKQSSSSRKSHVRDLARMQYWPALVKRALKHKKEARYVDADGLLPLHWAVSGGPPVEVVETLLHSYPNGASALDFEGSTPLHFACHYGANANVVELLLAAYPDGISKQDRYGRSPLFHAVDKRANLEVVRCLIRADPSMITKPCLPQDNDLTRKIRDRDRRPPQHTTPLFLAWSQVATDRQTKLLQSGRLWEKAEMLLQSAYGYHSSQQIYRIVHASVTLDAFLPPEVLRFAIALFPGQLSEREESTGRAPLSIAAAMNQLLMSRSTEMIRMLIEANPKAARMLDHLDRTPLSLAAASGKAWTAGIEDLFRAAPDLIQQRDGLSKTFPALVTASSTPAKETDCVLKPRSIFSTFPLREKGIDVQTHAVQKQREEAVCDWKEADPDSRHLSTIFELIRADPSIMK